MLDNNIYIKLDYFIKELNICVEFNGDRFHGNPKFYKATDTPNPYNTTLTAAQMWEKDKQRYDGLKRKYNITTYVIWEDDYLNNRINIEEFIEKTLGINLY